MKRRKFLGASCLVAIGSPVLGFAETWVSRAAFNEDELELINSVEQKLTANRLSGKVDVSFLRQSFLSPKEKIHSQKGRELVFINKCGNKISIVKQDKNIKFSIQHLNPSTLTKNNLHL